MADNEMKIRDCNCASKYQDAKYGKNKRVYNPTKDGGGRCSVCSTKK